MSVAAASQWRSGGRQAAGGKQRAASSGRRAGAGSFLCRGSLCRAVLALRDSYEFKKRTTRCCGFLGSFRKQYKGQKLLAAKILKRKAWAKIRDRKWLELKAL
jgi:hypothetical protein